MGKFLPFFPTAIYVRKAFCLDLVDFSMCLHLPMCLNFTISASSLAQHPPLVLDTTLEHEVYWKVLEDQCLSMAPKGRNQQPGRVMSLDLRPGIRARKPG